MYTWTPKAELYDFGRPLPASSLQALFQRSSTLTNLESCKRQPRVFEPGSGTGRVLLPLAQLFPAWRFIGQDYYGAALEVCRSRADQLGLNNIELSEVDVTRAKFPRAYDAILHSSVLHYLPSWRSILKDLTSALRPGGCMILVGDNGDIYDAALGRALRSGYDESLIRFWAAYLQLRKDLALEGAEASQRGCRWDLESTEIVAEVESLGFVEIERLEETWDEQFSVSNMLQIVKERCYSSMFTADDSGYGNLVHRLEKEFQAELDQVANSRHVVVARFFKPKDG